MQPDIGGGIVQAMDPAHDRSLFMAPTPDTSDIMGVELVRTGSHRPILGPGEITADHLRSIIDAAQDQQLRDAVLGIGHFDSRFEIVQDGDPAYGWVRNLRTQENQDGSQSLIGDYVGVPTLLAGLIQGSTDRPSPYRSRSVEIAWNVQSPSGRDYPAVLEAVKLLGQRKPAIQGLQDVLDMYYPAERTAAASAERHTTLLAEVNVDDIRSAYYETLTTQQREALFVAELWVDTQADPPGGYLITRAGDEINRVPFSLRPRDGSISFSDPERVRVQYVTAASAAPDQHEVMLLRDSGPPGVVRSPLAGQEGRRLDREQIVQLLTERGLQVPDNASDEQLMQLLRDNVRAEQPEPTPEPPPEPQPPTEPEPQPSPQQPQADTVTVSRAAWDELQGFMQDQQTREQQRDGEAREALVASALSDGRIRPAERDHYITLLSSQDPGTREATRTLLASLQPVVPMHEIGVTAGADPSGEDTQQEGTVSVLRQMWPDDERYKPQAAQGGN